ncbi:MAG: peptidase M23 [Sphingobacteriaceae bacterium]|nr:MAG: peptidase M23 [Sphingobacteriaceae bacterium]
MDASLKLANYLSKHSPAIGKVVDLVPDTDRVFYIDLTKNNPELTPTLLGDLEAFNRWVDHKLHVTGCRYAAGGYMEQRAIYESRPLFEAETEPRSLHLGIDIWATAGTLVYAPLDGTIHSFRDNDNYGDYGPTIILQHQLEEFTLYSLYGHLSHKSLEGVFAGQPVTINQKIGELGSILENGHWPPHLHFQLMLDMEGQEGDYPGVCKLSEMEQYLKNIPNPNLLLQFLPATYR